VLPQVIGQGGLCGALLGNSCAPVRLSAHGDRITGPPPQQPCLEMAMRVGVSAHDSQALRAERRCVPRLSVSRCHGIMRVRPHKRERSQWSIEQTVDRVGVDQDTGTGRLGGGATEGIALASGEPGSPSERRHRRSPRASRPPGGNAAGDSSARGPLPRGVRGLEEGVICSTA